MPQKTTPQDARSRSPSPPKRGVEDVVFDKRSVIAALAIAVAFASLALVWRVTNNAQIVRKPPPREFEFSLAEPRFEQFSIRGPDRPILRENSVDRVDMPVLPSAPEEKPNVHMSVAPSDAYVPTEVVQSPNTEFSARQPEFRIDPKDIGVAAKGDIAIDDAPERIDFVSDVISFPIQPIAVTIEGPADVFKYDPPSPRDKPQLYTMATGPRPGRPMVNIIRAFGDQAAPSMGQLGPANIHLFGTGDVFRQFTRAGGVKAKSSVDSALHWLAVHQGPDGTWKCENLGGTKQGSLASTGLATLALMSGGHTARRGEYSRNVLRALEAMMRYQKEDGLIAAGGDNLYTHAICTIALCEAYGRARDHRIGAAAQRAIVFCEKAVNADGGWRYTPQSPASDMSVTAWFIQALKTARLAQLKVDSATYSQAMAFVDSVTDAGGGKDSNGAVTYMYNPEQRYELQGRPALTAAAMMVRQFSGVGVKNHLLVKGAGLTRRQPPSWSNKNFYLWYYATYAMHNMGGEYRIWWNQKIRDVLLEHQIRDGDNAGSWDPSGDNWAAQGGRAYTTAFGALCLEVYYRYSEALTSFGAAPDLDELFLQQ